MSAETRAIIEVFVRGMKMMIGLFEKMLAEGK